MKTRNQRMQVIAIAAMVMFSISNTIAQHEHHNMDGNENQPSEMQAPTFKKEAVGAAYQHYIHLKSALVSSDVTEAQNGANMLATSLTKVEGGNEVHKIASTIADAEDLKMQRKHFAKLSDPMATLVDGQIASGAIYQAYCPMANGNTGAYWLSNAKTIRNPYFGDKMLSCGSVKETLK